MHETVSDGCMVTVLHEDYTVTLTQQQAKPIKKLLR